MRLYTRFVSAAIILSSLMLSAACSEKPETSQVTAKTSDYYETSSYEKTSVTDSSENEDFSDRELSSITGSADSSESNDNTDSETEYLYPSDSSQESSKEEAPQEPDEDALMVQEILNGTLEKRSALLDVTPLYQYPELPTGCESVSLTMALNYLGEDLSLTEIASDYLIYGNDMVTGYCGDPFGDYGAGIYPPGLLATVKNYINTNSSPLAAADTTGTQLSDLFKLIDKGFPVVIWSTSSLRDPYNNDDEMYIEYNGYEYWWYTNEHCVILIGYDLDSGTVTINDPQYGCSLTYSLERFEYVYDMIRRMSLAVIKK